LDSSTTLTLAVLRGQEAATRSLTFSRDGKTLYSAAEDGVVRAWDLTSAGETSVLRGHSSFVYPVAFSPNGEMLASGSWDQTVRLWDLRSRQERAVLRGHTRAVRSLAFSPDNRKLISITLFGEEEFVWDLATGQYVPLPQRKTGLQNVPEISAFFRDGKRIWLPGDPGTKEKVWNLETGSVETIPLYELRDLSDPRVSPDGRWIARPPGLISIEDPTIRRPYAEGVDRAAFKPDGTQLAGIKHRYPVMPDTIMVWDVASGRELFRLQGHIGEIFDVRFSPDGRRLATSGRDATICIWDAENFEELVLLRGHQDYIWSIDWSPDGRALASGSGDTTVRIWRSEK